MNAARRCGRTNSETTRPPAETWRVLFLDNAANVELLKEAARDVGYVVVGATTIEEANLFLEGQNHVDVIVCAAHLEEESMFAFLGSVRGSLLHAESKFLILSLEPTRIAAFIDRSTARAGLALGADSYLVMPTFDPGVLVLQIRKLLPPVPVLQQPSPDGAE